MQQSLMSVLVKSLQTHVLYLQLGLLTIQLSLKIFRNQIMQLNKPVYLKNKLPTFQLTENIDDFIQQQQNQATLRKTEGHVKTFRKFRTRHIRKF